MIKIEYDIFEILEKICGIEYVDKCKMTLRMNILRIFIIGGIICRKKHVSVSNGCNGKMMCF